MIKNTSKNPMIEWLFGGNPDAIERQEKQGQKEMIEASNEGVQQLPAKGNGCNPTDIYKVLGFEVIGQSEGDPLFFDVKMKNGFSLKPTDHSMWNDLVDGKGRVRASIFYKAAFYDRDAFINPLKTRYNVRRKHFKSQKQYDDFYQERNETPIVFECVDCGKVIFTTTEKYFTEKYNKDKHHEWWDAYHELEQQQTEVAAKFLDSNFPNWPDSMAYWD